MRLAQFASYSSDSLKLNIRPFTLRFSTSYELWRNLYVLQVESNVEGLHFSARCYLQIILGQVEAVIRGGENRQVLLSKELWIDGSLSYDLSKRKEEVQFSAYYWNCYSLDDSRNPFCHPNISSVAVFSIPANSFKNGCRYQFHLQVTRDTDPNVSSKKVQVVTMISYNILQLTIECIRNCQRDYFTTNSKVHLKSKCTNCRNEKLRYKWYIDGQLVLTSDELVMRIRTASNVTQIKLLASSADGRYGRNYKTLIKNRGPVGGTCSIYPKEGQEAVTAFYPCCRNFVSMNNPIEYFLYAGSILIKSCMDCNCEVFLPIINFIKVLVCDVFWVCQTVWLKVKVTPNNNIPIWPLNMLYFLEEGLLHRYLQGLQSIATHSHIKESRNLLLGNFSSIQPESWSSLARLANLTLTLAHRLHLADPKTKAILTILVRKINDNFEEIYLNNNVSYLTTEHFIKITLDCLEILNVMESLCKKFSPPPWPIYDQYYQAFLKGKLKKPLFEKLFSKIQEYEYEDEWKFWLNCTWESFRLHQNLKSPRNNIYQSNLREVRKRGKHQLALEHKCYDTIPSKMIKIFTRDEIHIVLITPAVFKDVLGTDPSKACFRILSFQRDLHWWYPIEKKPSSRLLSVRVFEREDNITTHFALKHSKIRYKTFHSGHFHIHSHMQPAEDQSDFIKQSGVYVNTMAKGTLTTYRKVRMYRVLLTQTTLLAVHFTKATHKLQVLLKTHEKPLMSEISASKCTVPASTDNKTLLLRNNCQYAIRVYIALRVFADYPIRKSPKTPIADGPAEFAFAFQIRSCNVWSYTSHPGEQKWLHTGCHPTMTLSVKHAIGCTCTVLGTYTNYVHYVPAIEVPVAAYEEARINFHIVLFYAILFPLIVLWILWLWKYRNSLPSKTIRFPGFEAGDQSSGEPHDIIISLRTGGRLNAGTSASLTVVLYDQFKKERKINVFQDPGHTFLKENTMVYLWIRTRDIRIPTRVLIYHNNAGRFPSWFLRRVEVSDVQVRKTQVFMARKWVKQKNLALASDFIYGYGEQRLLDSWSSRFKISFEMLWINWALWQPVSGKWRESPHFSRISRAKRVCIFVCKLLVTFTVCALHYKPTTTISLQRIRGSFLSYKDVVVITMICCSLEIVIYVMFVLVSWKWG
ncbi:uncharacterized protein LOC108086615 [Drosophila ficusphila]|uniref:uncharacterized protein LOC108086615 n=1 Tax=Drosophila ficusphila TaxID=30025 RepID=UPI0007E72D38|nr:uncharacterized protein LOC108086615 [Drosophila ficusphila]